MRKLNEKCAVFGVFGKKIDVARTTFFGLYALQHRGQEASGMCVTDGERLLTKKGVGLVPQVYNEESIQTLSGNIAIGHNRYSTSRTEADEIQHVQPYVCKNQHLALAHNGNLPNTQVLEIFLQSKGIETKDHNDSKLMHLAIEVFLGEGNSIVEAVKKAYPLFTGAFSLLIMTHDTLIAVRDKCGMRPLSVGRIEGDLGYAFASETCALNTVGVDLTWEVGPGEMMVCTKKGLQTHQLIQPNPKMDIFEFVYFARPDSRILGRSVYQARWSSGWEMAKEFSVDVDVVVPIPETSVPSAIGFAKYRGIPLETALIKNRYIHRTFIEPNQRFREIGVNLKLNVVSSVIRGKRVALIDDSIVRGTTSAQIIKMLFEAGAKEVHFLVASPPVKYPDFYGIDTPSQDKLSMAQQSVDELRDAIGATSLNFLSLEGLVRAIGVPKDKLSTSCFTGEYPIDIGNNRDTINFNV